MNLERISKWMKLGYVISYVTGFIINCKINKEKLKGVLKASEIQNLE